MAYDARCFEANPDPDWDSLIEATTGGELVQTTLWAASRQRLGVRSYRIVATAPDGALVGGCIMYAVRLTAGIWIGSIPRGPLVFADRTDVPAMMVRQALTMSRERGIRVLVIQPPEGAAAVEDAVTAAGFRLGVPSAAPEATVRIDLRRSDEELLSSMSSMRRRNIRKTLGAGFEVREERDIDVFHRLHRATAARQGFVSISRENLQAQWDLLSPPGMCKMFIARYQGMPVAGIWLTRFADTVTFKLAGWDAAARAPPHASDALHWTVLRWAREQGAHTYDLGGFERQSAERIIAGEALDESFRQSPSFFKLGFGGAPVLLPQARFVFTHKIADVAFGHAAQRCLPIIPSGKFVQRLRNGRKGAGSGSAAESAIRAFVPLIRPAYLRCHYLISRLNDRKLGIVTTDECVARELGYVNGTAYGLGQHRRAMPFTGIERVMRHLDPRPGDVLLDLGCGAGRVICVAATYPFSRVIGIDIDEKLCALAERNVRALKQPRVRPEVLCADAAGYRTPDDVTIVFLYNPFGGEMLRAALNRILESFNRAPRHIRVVYANPREHEMLLSTGRFRESDTLSMSWRPGKEWHRTQVVRFYEMKAPARAEAAQQDSV